MPPTKRLFAGEHLFRKGDAPGAMYVLLSGRLAVSADDVNIATLTKTGSFVGELSFLTGKPRTADVVAETESKVLVVDDIERFFREDSAHAVAVAKELAGRLEAMSQRFVEAKRIARSPEVGEMTLNSVMAVLLDESEDGTLPGNRPL